MIRKAAHARMQRSASSGHFCRQLLALGVVLAALLAPEPSCGRAATEDDVALALNVMIPMRDGVKLAADVYRPARDGVPVEGRFPALLMRTPYNKEVRAAPFAQYFASRGYVVVVQDVRARYRSEGHWRPLSDDGRDGYDTTQWIGHQSWSDGGIGTLGTSYEGGTQHALAIADAPFVKAMIPL
ncbi:MAG TPA: CocE/NonD family hydrolase, partial [Steroidobacteraceae bacterium]|nr:CocE/NonD family hydrolase [Steroidobacteraceae bacterium]